MAVDAPVPAPPDPARGPATGSARAMALLASDRPCARSVPCAARSRALRGAPPRRPRPTSAPGAGFALISSFLVVFVDDPSLAVALAPGLAVPRALARRCAGGRRAQALDPPPHHRRLRRPGPEAHRPAAWRRASCPTSQRLAEPGCYHRLRDHLSRRSRRWPGRPSAPATHPAKHNIFDFLDRDRRTYLPLLSSTAHRHGRALPHARPLPHPARQARAAAAAQVEAVLDASSASTASGAPSCACRSRFPPERFYGAQLSADVRARPARHAGHVPALHHAPGGASASRRAASASALAGGGDRFAGRDRAARRTPSVAGNPPLTLPARDPARPRGAARARHASAARAVELAPGRLSDWVTLAFRAAPGHQGARASAGCCSPRWTSTSRST